MSSIDDFTTARAAYLSFKLTVTSFPSLACTTSFEPSRLTTVPRTRTGVPSAQAGAALNTNGRTSAGMTGAMRVVVSEQTTAATTRGSLDIDVSSQVAALQRQNGVSDKRQEDCASLVELRAASL